MESSSTTGSMEYLPMDNYGVEEIINYADDDAEFELNSELDLGEYDGESMDESTTGDMGAGDRIGWPEQLRMIHFRSHLNELNNAVEKCQFNVDKTREELKKCNAHLRHLEGERDDIFRQVEEAESAGNTASLYRLRATHEKLCREIDGEQEVIRNIRERVDQAEYEFAKADVERGKYVLLEEELIQKEQQLQREKTEMAHYRIHKEETMARQGALQQQKQRRLQQEALEDRERRHRKAVKDAQESHDRVAKYLNATIEKMRKRQEEEHTRYTEDMQRKAQMLLKLKKDISSNRENLRALRARDKAFEEKEKERVSKIRKEIIDRGGNPGMEMMIKKRLDSFEKEKQANEAKKRDGQAKIMEKLLTEEMVIKKRRKQQRHLFVDPREDKSKNVKPLPKKPLKIFEKFCRDTGAEDLVNQMTSDSAPSKHYVSLEAGRDQPDDSADMMSLALGDSSDSESEGPEESSVNLAVPEFEGLWDQHKPYHVPKDTGGELKLPGATKMEKEIMVKVLEKHRQGIIKKQVAAGKQFEGRAFYSKPDIIHFKDFDVGQCYKKKVVLTNVSYSVNYCKFMGLTERLKDFIKIDFDPPGQMSAGLTCEMHVTFKPMINEDLEGEVHFMAQTGPFSIPLRCTTKKCDLRADTAVVEFGTTVIGETLKRSFVLTNNGALGTKFDFFKVTGMKQRTMTTAETSFGRLTTADTIRAVSPDSQEVTDKQKQEKDSKKKSSEDLAKLPEGSQDLGEGGALPGDGASSPLSQALALDPDKAGDDLEEVMSPDLAVSEMDDFGTLDGMKVGPISSGDIGPFSSVKLEIIWQPTIAGKVDSEFLISFADPLSESISIRAVGNAMDVPVWVERQSVDLKICMYDRLYQDTIVVNNRATTALRLKFEVCKELRNHLELLPKTGYIQAQSQFSAQLKFLPREGLAEEAGKFFDPATGVLEAPMTIRVADQTAPVPFTLHAVVTNSDMEFDVTNINFKCCTVYESVQTTIHLTNKSLLPQRFGFVGLPEYVEVQPEDGFGTLLPLETIDLDVIFSPKKAKCYEFELVCKSLINREFGIKCWGIGVLPPLELSHQVIHFAATALYDISSSAIHIKNSHTSSNEFTHPVPRIGKGEIAPVGPTSFELKLPENCPLSISPKVGTILPGEKARVLIHFAPKLEEETIRAEAVRMATKLLEAKAEKDYQEALRQEKEAAELAQQAAAKKGGKGRAPSPKGKGKGGAAPVPGQGSSIQKPGPIQPPDPKTISKDSPAYHAATGSLLRQFKGTFETVRIPVLVASGACGNPGEISYSIHNTLYLVVHCPTIKPPLVVISNHGKSTVDFGEVCIGQSVTQPITLQNISDRKLTLSSSILNTCGPFTIVNALRPLEPNETHTALISFVPLTSQVYQEQLEIKTKPSSLYLKLMGHGVSPKVTLTPDAPECVMGPVLVGEYCERQFKMNNTSSLAIEYTIKLESQSVIRHSNAQGLPAFIKKRPPHDKFCVGTQNNNGQAVFDLVPVSGTIPAGGSKEITITFAPDHASKHYADGVYIELFNQEESHYIKLLGAAYPSVMYLDGYDELLPSVESLCISERPPPQEDEEAKPAPPTVLLMLKCISSEADPQPVPRDLLVGCVRTMATSQKKDVKKKNGEFVFDNLQAVNAKGFNIDPPKGMVEAGVKKPVTFTWNPPPNHESTQIAEASILVTLKCDVSEQYRIILRGMLVTA